MLFLLYTVFRFPSERVCSRAGAVDPVRRVNPDRNHPGAAAGLANRDELRAVTYPVTRNPPPSPLPGPPADQKGQPRSGPSRIPVKAKARVASGRRKTNCRLSPTASRRKGLSAGLSTSSTEGQRRSLVRRERRVNV